MVKELLRVEILLKEGDGYPRHDGNALDGVNCAGWLILPPRFDFGPVGLNGVELRLWEFELVKPLGDRAGTERSG